MGRKVVINSCYGGFGLSKKAYEFLGLDWDGYGHGTEVSRDDPKLLECIEELGPLANGSFADLEVIEIPEDVDWVIEEYDGSEWVAEAHRTWM